MNDSYTRENDTLVIQRDLTELDVFVKTFLDILKQHCNYLVVSGFVSISTGRTRATEDVDVLVEVPTKELFNHIFSDLISSNFWCFQGDDADDVYRYVEHMQNIRFARINELFPNIELIFIDESKVAQYYEFTHPQTMRIKDFSFKIPPLEFEILYKELVLKGKKDLEDALHLRVLFSDILEKDKFIEIEKIIKEELR